MDATEKAELKKLYDRYVELKPLADEFRIVVDKLRPMLCKFKAGDMVTWISGGRKMRGKISTVSNCRWCPEDPSSVEIFVSLIRKDGSPSRVMHEVYIRDIKKEVST